MSGHVAFGVGIHACVGQFVARKEAEVLFGVMVRRIARIEALGPAYWRPGNALRTLGRAPLRFVT